MNQGQTAAPATECAGRKGNDPRKHHYVPVFYQTNFVNQDGLLWVYDRRLETYKELHPRVICFERDLYAVKPENKPRFVKVETELLSAVDATGDWGIRQFLNSAPNREAEESVAIFAAFQWTRVPTFSRDIRITYARAMDELNRIAFANVERARVLMERYAAENNEELKVTPESLVEAVRGKHIEITATETAFLSTMMEQATRLMRVLVRLNWEVLSATDDTGFILCDCPVVVVPPRGCNQVGFLIPGSAKYFPLSSRLCLRLGEAGNRRRLRNVGKEDVRIINQNIAANSERFIMGPSRLQLSNVVSRSNCSKIETIPRFTIETVQSDDNNAIQKISTQPRRYFYPKNGATSAP